MTVTVLSLPVVLGTGSLLGLAAAALCGALGYVFSHNPYA